MNIDYFIAAAESLVLTTNKFDYLVAHPTPDVLNSAAFKKKVITYFVAHGMEFSTTAYTLNQTSAWNFEAVYKEITAVLRAVQSQLSYSGSCSEVMESIFATESLTKHPLKALRCWKRMADS
eukprot:415196-Rhodomonas_salina.1